MNETESKIAGDARRSATVDRGVGHLVVINGGGAAALLAFLQAVWDKDANLAAIVLLPLFVFALGTATAGAINLFRYKSSLLSEHYKQSQKEDLRPKQERWTRWSEGFQWSAVALFVLGAFTVTVGAALILAKMTLTFAISAEVLVVVVVASAICLLLRFLLPRDQ